MPHVRVISRVAPLVIMRKLFGSDRGVLGLERADIAVVKTPNRTRITRIGWIHGISIEQNLDYVDWMDLQDYYCVSRFFTMPPSSDEPLIRKTLIKSFAPRHCEESQRDDEAIRCDSA